MSVLSTVLTIVLGTGGLAGLGVLLRLRTDKASVMVTTIERGVMVQERIIDRLEKELAAMTARAEAAEAELVQRRAKRRNGAL